MKLLNQLKSSSLLKLSVNLFLLFLLFSSCEKQPVVTDPPPTNDGHTLKALGRGSLVCSKLLITYSAEQLKAMMPDLAPGIRYDISIYKISYLTQYKGKIIQVSGAIGIPAIPANQKAPIVAFNHGTKFSDGDFLPSSGQDIGTILTTTYGYICFAPDYIGFGDSEQIFHPYLINAASNAAVGDMIIAGKQFLTKSKITPKAKLFMFGFSQGGLVTTAAQKAFENESYYKSKIRLTAVASGLGPYGLNDQSFQPIFNTTSYVAPSFFLFAFIAYNDYYGFGKSLDQMFKNSYGQLFIDLLKQDKSFYELNPQFPTVIADLMQDDIRKEVAEGKSVFNKVFDKNNTIDGWVPKAPLRIYHSPTDEMVPYANAVAAYDAFVAAGAKSVEFITLPPVGHELSAGYASSDIMAWFESF